MADATLEMINKHVTSFPLNEVDINNKAPRKHEEDKVDLKMDLRVQERKRR